MSNDWLRQRKEITIRPREEAEASKDSDKQINRKRGSHWKKKILSTWKALAETVGEIKREKGEIQSALLVIGEAGGMGVGVEAQREKEEQWEKMNNNGEGGGT